MFQDKNKTDKKTQTDFSSSMLPDVPVHLMKNDLEEIKNPKKEIPLNSIKPSINFSEKQKSSPFFSPTKTSGDRLAEHKKIPEPFVPAPPKEPARETKKDLPISTSPFFSRERTQEIKKENPKEIETSVFSQPKELRKTDTAKTSENSTLNKIIVAFAAFLLILAVGASGYYFWILKAQDQNKPEENQTTTPPKNEAVSLPEPEPKKEKVIEISTEKLNYLIINIETADKNFLKEQLAAYLKKAEELKITAPAELILTDELNNPVSFKSFAEKMEINFSAPVIAALKDTFSLFIYNDNNNYRLGIAIDSANISTLRAAMLKEEPNLVNKLTPILNNPENKKISEGEFSLNNYKGTAIRYLNIVSPEYLSIDYTLFQKRLIFTTTKAMALAIIDHLTPVSEQKETKSSSVEIEKKETTEEKTENTATLNKTTTYPQAQN